MPAEKLWARAWPSAVRSTATMGPRPGTRTRPRRSGPKRGGGSDQVRWSPLDRGRPRPLRLLRVVARARVLLERVVHARVHGDLVRDPGLLDLLLHPLFRSATRFV